MNEHHFSYPVVVPLRGVTISGHAIQTAAPIAPLRAPRLTAPPVRQAAAAAPARKLTSVAA